MKQMQVLISVPRRKQMPIALFLPNNYIIFDGSVKMAGQLFVTGCRNHEGVCRIACLR